MFNLFRLFFKQKLYKIFEFNSLKFKPSQIAGLNYLSLILFLSLLLFAASCNTTEPPIIPPPPPDLRKITLTFEDASCTEVWLNIKVDSLTLPVELTLKQYNPTGDSLSQIFVLNTQDTVLYIDSLSPNQTYNYQAILSTDTTIKSEKVTVQTLETTSHNFTWQSWTFGQQSSSVLYDVAIIDENNIWAVGEIYTEDSYTYDSLGNWIDPYNAVHWNGNNWELVRIYYNYNGSNTWSPIRTILAFSSNDIWFSAGIHWNGINFITKPMNINFPYLINKMWGTSSSDFYIVGNSGSMAHYNGTTWTQIESGTTLNIYDIWGDINPYTNEYEIIALASNIFLNQGNKLLQIKNDQVQELNNTGLPWGLTTLWFKPLRIYYVGGDGLYTIKQLGNDWVKDLSIPAYFKFEIRGQSLNDIVLCGSFGLLMHYNGIDWKNYQDITYLSNGTYGSIKLKGNVICASGPNGRKAIITIGRRN